MPYCAHCNNIYFVSRDAFRQHVKNSRNHPWCRLCNRKFVDEAGYDDHMASAHTDNEHCETCDLSFINETALYKHYRDSRAHPTCPDCNEGFYSENSLRNHVAQFHSYQEHCTLCQRQFVNRVSLEQHYLESSRHPSCDECGCGFIDDSAFDRHVAERHADYGYCVPCQRQFLNRAALAQHYHDSSRHPTCDYCNCGFVDDETLYHHTEISHPNVHCEACHRSFVDEAACSQHFLKSPAHATYRCKFCDEVFHDDDEYDLHIESHLPEYCGLCKRGFVNKGAIYQHFFDSAEHPSCIFGCHCGLANESEYQDHLKSQHGTCGACKLVLASRSALQEHYLESSLHPTCQMCNQGFEDIERYTSHSHRVPGDSSDKITWPSSGDVQFPLNLRTSGLVFSNIMEQKIHSAARGEEEESDCDVYGSELSTPRQAAQIPLPGDSPISNGECDEVQDIIQPNVDGIALSSPQDVPSISGDDAQATSLSIPTDCQITEDFTGGAHDHQSCNSLTASSDSPAEADAQSNVPHVSSYQTGPPASAPGQAGGGDSEISAPLTPTSGNGPVPPSPTPHVSIVITPPDPSDSHVTSSSTPHTPSSDVRDIQGSPTTVCPDGPTDSDAEHHQVTSSDKDSVDVVNENPSEEDSRLPESSEGTEQNDDVTSATGKDNGGDDASDDETERPEDERTTCEDGDAIISPSDDLSAHLVELTSRKTSGAAGDTPKTLSQHVQEEGPIDQVETTVADDEHQVENPSDQQLVAHDVPFEAKVGEVMSNAESDDTTSPPGNTLIAQLVESSEFEIHTANSAAVQLAIPAGKAEINVGGPGNDAVLSQGNVEGSDADDAQFDINDRSSTRLVADGGKETAGTDFSAETSSDQPSLEITKPDEVSNSIPPPTPGSTSSGENNELTGHTSELAGANLKDDSIPATLDGLASNSAGRELTDRAERGVTIGEWMKRIDSKKLLISLQIFSDTDASDGDMSHENGHTTIPPSEDSMLDNGEEMMSATNIKPNNAVRRGSMDDNIVAADYDGVGGTPDESLMNGVTETSTSGVEPANNQSNKHNNSMEDTKGETNNEDGGEGHERNTNVTTPASINGATDNKDTTHANREFLSNDGPSSTVDKRNGAAKEKAVDRSNYTTPEISNVHFLGPSEEVAVAHNAEHSAAFIDPDASANTVNNQSGGTHSNNEIIPNQSNATLDAATGGKSSRRNRRNRRNRDRKRRNWTAKSGHASNVHPQKEESGFTTDHGDGAKSDITETQSASLDGIKNHLTIDIPDIEMDSPFFAAMNLPLPPHSPIESESPEADSESVASSRLLELLQAAGIGGIGLPPSESSMTLNDMDDEEDGDEKYLTPSLASPEERYFANIGPAYDDHHQLAIGDSTYAHALGDNGDSLLNLPVHTSLDPDAKDNAADVAPLSTSQADSVSSTPSKLYCRICHADPCVDVTATFCGHIFCYGCITKHVMQESKCAVCSAPTLLYLLFKLDLSV